MPVDAKNPNESAYKRCFTVKRFDDKSHTVNH